MSEYTWFHDPESGRSVYRKIRHPSQSRSDLPCPMVVTDEIEVKSMVDGKMYTSKAALRQSYREKGYIEVGNEWLDKEPKRPEIKEVSIKDSLNKAFTQVGISD